MTEALTFQKQFEEEFLNELNPKRGHDHPAQAPMFEAVKSIDEILSETYRDYCNNVPADQRPWSKDVFRSVFHQYLAYAATESYAPVCGDAAEVQPSGS